MKIRFVSGEKVRKRHINFLMGCNDLACPYVPRGEIWIDRHMTPCDRKATIVHETTERKLMADGMKYAAAHRKANVAEMEFRQKAKVCK